MSDCDACDAAVAHWQTTASTERDRADKAEARMRAIRKAFEVAVMGWWNQLTDLQRQNADLQAANTALLLRARQAEAEQLEAEAALEEQEERDEDRALEWKNERD